MNAKTTKRALFSSVLAIVLCLAMLIGTTFAWFTDTASTGVNKIQAGNLDVDIQNEEGTSITDLNWVLPEGDTRTQDGILWEPGCTYTLTPFKIVNKGTLALKYKLTVTGLDAAGSTGPSLLDVIDFTYSISTVDDEGNATNVALDLSEEGHLIAGASTGLITISAHMREEAGNDYMNKTLDGIKINVDATQDTVENDSFNNQYDKFAEYDNVTTVAIPAGDTETVNTAFAVALKNAVTSDVTTGATATQITLPANTEVTLPSGAATAPNGKTKDIKITGDKSTVVSLVNTAPGSEGKLSYQDGANLTFQGVTVNASAIEGLCARGGVVTFIDCKFDGELKKTIASKFVFSGCEFTEPVSQVGYGCKDVVFDDCTFNTDGYGIKIYSEGSTPVNLTVKNSRFNNTGSAAKSAIFLDHIIDNITYNITVDSCTFTGFTATPTPNYNRWATRVIVDSSFVQTADGQYVFAYQTGEEGGSYHKILTIEQLVVTVK